MECHLPELAAVWVGQRLDLVAVQETHVTWGQAARLQRQLTAACRAVAPDHPGYWVCWAYNTAAGGARSAGAAVLIRQDMYSSGQVEVRGQPLAQSQGRLLALSVRWGGHAFRLANVHLPNDSSAQQQFMDSHLRPAVGAVGDCLLGGDFNFVDSTSQDRLSTAAAQLGPEQPVAARHLHQRLPGLVDVFRQRHPQRVSYTHHQGASAARLDRWYARGSVADFCMQCHTSDTTPSDHRPVILQLAAKQGAQQGHGLPRARLHQVLADTAARQHLEQYIQHTAAAAPEEDGAFLDWWVGWKVGVLHETMQCAREVRQRQAATLVQARRQAALGITAAYEAVERATTPAQAAAALRQVTQARQQWCESVRQQAAAAEWQQRRDWVHNRERPNPRLTGWLDPEKAAPARAVPPLQSPVTGRIVAGGKPLAQLVVEYWARVSADPVVDHAATQEVLAAVREAGLTLSEVVADGVGAVEVSQGEVMAALKHSAPGKAPGLDGLPVELYRRYADVCAPLLSRLYTAIGRLGRVPAGFTDGVIKVLPKGGGEAQVGNYRPITLLNTDYRVLAKVLAYRLKAVQGSLIGPEQTAFVPGRHIGNNIMLLQTLPHALEPTSQAVAVFCDFAKAYDTVSRSFLYALLQEAGLGGGFLRWVRLLLQDTFSCACVNGHVSDRVQFQAGVRQGCPLAPLLYLFVGQALLSLLKRRGFGVEVGGMRITACQFADDVQVFLEALAQLPAFLQCMGVFAAASGQGLNVRKTRALVLGKAARYQLWLEHFKQQHQQHQHQQQQHQLQQPQQPQHRRHQQEEAQASQPQQPATQPVQQRQAGRQRTGTRPASQPQLHPVQRRFQRTHLQDLARLQHAALAPAAVIQRRREELAAAQQRHRQLALATARAEQQALTGRPAAGALVRHLRRQLGAAHLEVQWAATPDPAAVAATQQLLNEPSSVPLAARLAGLELVGAAKSLGVVHHATGYSSVDWDALLQQVYTRYAYIAKLPLSMFGRAFAASGYGLAKILYAAEFVGLPPEPALQQLIKATARLVDKGKPPTFTGRCFGGVSADMLVGNPKEGGFGVMPLREHVQARHAMWAVRLMQGSPQVPWVHVARHILTKGLHGEVAAVQLGAIAMCGEGLKGPNGHLLPPPLKRLASGLNALSGWQDGAGGAQEQLGAWCHDAPLWGNPFVVARAQHDTLPRCGLERRFCMFMLGGRVHTVGDVVTLQQLVQEEMPPQEFRQRVWAPWLGNDVALQYQPSAQAAVAELVAAIRPDWLQAAQQAAAHPLALLAAPSTRDTAANLLLRYAWCMPCGKVVRLATASVRAFTLLQQQQRRAARAAKHAAFLQLVNTGLLLPHGPPVGHLDLGRLLVRLWRLPWDNKVKELFWRLTVDGKPTLARMHAVGDSCACGAVAPGRLHHYWECPVAKAVVRELRRCLPRGVALHQVHVWAGRKPMQGLHGGVWLVVCQATLLAMDHGRAMLYRWRQQQRAGEALPQRLVTLQQRLQVAEQRAVATLWDRLHDFAGLGLCPPQWLMQVGFSHPFMRVVLRDSEHVLEVHR